MLGPFACHSAASGPDSAALICRHAAAGLCQAPLARWTWMQGGQAFGNPCDACYTEGLCQADQQVQENTSNACGAAYGYRGPCHDAKRHRVPFSSLVAEQHACKVRKCPLVLESFVCCSQVRGQGLDASLVQPDGGFWLVWQLQLCCHAVNCVQRDSDSKSCKRSV